MSETRKRRKGKEEKKTKKKLLVKLKGRYNHHWSIFLCGWVLFVCLYVCLFVCLRGGCGVLLWFLASWRRERDKDITERDREWMEDRQTNIHTDECKGNKKKNKGYMNIHKAENEIVNDVE